MCDNSLISFLNKFSIICLLETFYVNDTLPDIFPNHKRFFTPAKKISEYGRASGGVYVFVIESLLANEIDICSEIDFTIALELKTNEKNILFISSYIPPYDSNYYNNISLKNGVSILENVLLELKSVYTTHSLIVCGDFNSRCGNVQPPLVNDSLDFYIDNDLQCRESISSQYCRNSEDTVTNIFGKSFIDMCYCLDLYIVNGTTVNAKSGLYTYIHPQGNSVVDYFLISDDLLVTIDDFIIHEATESLHMPVSISFNFISLPDTLNSIDSTDMYKIIWDRDKSAQYQSIFSHAFNNQLHCLIDSVYVDINKAVKDFSSVLTSCAHFMQVKFSGYQHTSKVWFDHECKNNKALLRRSLHRYTNNRSDENKSNYIQMRKNYKYLLRSKKRIFNEKIVRNLCNSANNPTKFWKEIRQILSPARTTNSINLDQWFSHFKNIFQQAITEPPICNELPDSRRDNNSHENDNVRALNEDLQIPEILKAIKNLKTNKSPGLDCVLGEMLKVNSTLIAPFLQILFNQIFKSNVFPIEWGKSVIVPLHKKNNPNNCDNYRPISLTSLVSKVYTSILNNRLSDFIEAEQIVGEEQAGFRNGYSTVDNMYTLYSMILKQFYKNRKLYVAFVDFRKCFDSINRDALLIILERNGITGNMLHAIKGMYSCVQSAVRSNGDLTDFFECPIGLKQGCQMSPKLFLIFATEFSRNLNLLGRHGIQFNPGSDIIHHLLFADDMALISDTVSGLQTKLNILYDQCLRLGIDINLDKTNIIVFRKGGQLSKHEHWKYGERNIEVVNSYRYLGIDFSTRLSFKASTTALVNKAKKGAFEIISSLYNSDCHDFKIFAKLFDAKIQPILCYGSEIWGITENTNVEQVHTNTVKRFLGVSTHTANTTLLAESGRYPLSIIWKIKIIRYWLKLQEMSTDRFPRQAYDMLERYSNNGHTNWVTHIKNILCENGYGYVWLFKHVGSIQHFCQRLKYTLCANFIQSLNTKIEESDKLQFYNSFKNVFEPQSYLSNSMFNRHLRNTLVQFRLSVSKINGHRFKFSADPEKRMCPICKSHVEDEFHVIFVCNPYENLRLKYLPFYARENRRLDTLVKLLKSHDNYYSLSLFLAESFRVRDTILKSMDNTGPT